ncbi:uncharacterized protein LOC135695672 [Rhopilema esculentum]|uniref:uncharacterized protein LOC135695672 n=1 Tax=Rhopilema esculentum TaxID=499914 RepID=UPI0031D3E7ED
MSLVRVSARLPLRSCLRTANAACQRLVKMQDTFEGVVNAFFWDEKCGFGETQDGNHVLVSNEFKTGGELSVKMDHQLWLEIIEPTSYINHEALRDELQMTVLSYDDDVLGQDGNEARLKTVPIYKGHIEVHNPIDDCPPGGETAGFNGGSRTATA